MAKKLTTEDLVLNIIVNSNKAQSEIGKLARSIQDNTSKVKAAETEMKKLERANATSSTRYKQLQSDVGRYNTVINQSKTRLTELNQSLSIQDKSLKQLENSLRRTRQLWRQATNDTDRKRYSDEMGVLNRRIVELRNGSDQTGNSLMRMSQNIQKYFAVITAGIASFMAAFSGVRKAITEYARFDDILADVMKTTNLTKNSVKELNDELERIDTRTSQEDLLGLSRIAGKLGYTEISDITEFVKANNQIIVALNEDLGGNVEETVNKIGKLVDVFKLQDLYDTEDAFLKVGSALNELGMASTANEGYMVEFARRMAGVAPLAGISIEQILGLGAALDQLGQSEEVASTALSKLFLAIAKDAQTYSRYAGMEVNAFKDLLEKDFMGAFTRVLQGVRNSSEGISALASTLGDLGQDGGRVIGVIGSLANNVDILTGSITLSNKAMADGSSITDEFNIKNETVAAKLDRTRKEVSKFWRELGEKLWPAIAEGNTLWASFLRLLISFIGFISSNIKWISSLAVAVVTYYTAVQIAAKWEAITTAYMVAKRVIAIALSGTYALLTGNLARATAAQRLLNITMAANPYGLLVAGIALIVTALINYNENLRGIVKSHDSLNKAMKSAGDQTAGETQRIKDLNSVLTDTNETTDKRLAALDQLKQVMPGVLDGYTQEEILAGKARVAINQYTEALILNAQIKAKQQELDDLASKARQVERNEVGFITGAYREVRQFFIGAAGAAAANATDNVESLMNIKAASKEVTDSLIEDQTKLNNLYKAKPAEPTNQNTGVIPSNPKAAKKAEQARKAAYKMELEDAEKHYQDQLQAEGLFRKDKRTMTAEELEKLAAIEEEYQKKVDSINQQYGKSLKDTSKVADAELTKRLASESKTIDSILKKRQSDFEAEKEAYRKRLEDAGLYGKEKENLTEDQQLALEYLTKEHQDNLLDITREGVNKEVDTIQNGYKEELADMRIAHREELASITSLSQAKKKLSSVLSNRELREVKTLGQAKRIIENQQRLEEETATRHHLEKLLGMLQDAVASGNFEGIDLSDALLPEEKVKVLLDLIRELKEEIAKLKGGDLTDGLDSKNGSVDIFGMSSDDWEKLLDNIKEGKIEFEDLLDLLGAATQMWQQYSSIVTSRENAMLQKDQEANDRKKENLQKRLDAGTLTQESYNKQVSELDQEMDKKRAETQRKQAKREKAAALMSAIVNTARAVTAVLPNWILAAIVGAFGAIQVATIASTPLPSVEGRASGGTLKVERSQDGKVFDANVDPTKRGYVNSPTVIVGEDGSEWVANAQAVKNPTVRPILDVLDTAQRNGTINTLNLQDVIAGTLGRGHATGRQSGGSVTGKDTSSAAHDPRMYEILKKLDKTVTKLDVGLKNLKADVSLIGKNGFLEAMDEYNTIEQDANF
ncbi:phage tail tape measure protein [Sphingobacterium shayense]|uniref:phage tail tape measure protein n=1 Tax=Sphingobacterium shayense TaxID=626343 RepID=UPI001556E8A6|nr:phage tail tape measure protein [Sphingobacterium shayense]NQD71330.1 phage tail tape measure protein [Sphingobacterium shayense]